MPDSQNSEGVGSRLQKVVESIAISPGAARELVDGYRRSFRGKHGHDPKSPAEKRAIANKIIGRYAKYSAASGVVTALPGTVPGIGTILATLGGGMADVAWTMKIQVDMCMCLVDIYEEDLSEEDKKHFAFILALATSVEQLATTGGKKLVESAAKRAVYQYLKGPALVTIKALFKKIGITFTQKAAGKAIPFGIGAVFSGATNHILTTFVGKTATSILAKDV